MFSRGAIVRGSVINIGVVSGPDGHIISGFRWRDMFVSRGLVEL